MGKRKCLINLKHWCWNYCKWKQDTATVGEIFKQTIHFKYLWIKSIRYITCYGVFIYHDTFHSWVCGNVGVFRVYPQWKLRTPDAVTGNGTCLDKENRCRMCYISQLFFTLIWYIMLPIKVLQYLITGYSGIFPGVSDSYLWS